LCTPPPYPHGGGWEGVINLYLTYLTLVRCPYTFTLQPQAVRHTYAVRQSRVHTTDRLFLSLNLGHVCLTRFAATTGGPTLDNTAYTHCPLLHGLRRFATVTRVFITSPCSPRSTIRPRSNIFRTTHTCAHAVGLLLTATGDWRFALHGLVYTQGSWWVFYRQTGLTNWLCLGCFYTVRDSRP